MQSILNKISNLEKLIGNTPLIEITFKYKDRPLKIYSKIEYYNYTGSIKDRVALYIIKKAYLTGKIKEKDIVAALKSMLGIYAKVKLVEPKSITRSDGKAVRVIDKRKI